MRNVTYTGYSKAETHDMGVRAYIALTTLWVVVGLSLTALGAAATYGMAMGWGLAIGTFLVALLGILVVKAAEPNAFAALFGYALIAFPMGALFGPMAAAHEAHLVSVVGTTVILSVGLGGIGVLIPKSLQSWGSYLLGGLIALIVAQFSATLLAAVGLPVEVAFSALDWVGIFLFSAFIVYDMNQALQKTRTYYNSIDSAVALHLSILNLFSRLLSTKD